WTSDKPTSGIQEAARDARYQLRAQWGRAHRVLHLLTADHREDQVETHLIRRRAGSGIDGLAGMSAVRELAGCRLVRPLLAVPRARLLALLAQEDQPFLRDPSNLNPAFERARLRLHPAVIPEDVVTELHGPAAASAPVRLEPGANLVWDRRFAVNLAAIAPSGFTLDYLGPGGAAVTEGGAGDLPRLIYSVLPALWDEEGLAAVPHLGW